MQPIKYDAHCKACHPLTFDTDKEALPHGQPLAKIDILLEAAYKDYKPSPAKPSSRPLLSKPLASPEQMRTTADLVKEAKRYIEGTRAGCVECHFIEVREGKKEIEPVHVPEVWFKHAKFSHLAHPSTVAKCIDCHGKAKESTDHADVLIPDLKSCQTCHAPEKSEGGRKIGGARHDCTACHVFHHNEQVKPGVVGLDADPRTALEWRLLLPSKSRK